MANRIVTAGEAYPTPNWDKWRLIPEPRLWQCVALSLNIDPDSIEMDPIFGRDPILPRRLREFGDRIDIARENLHRTLRCTAVAMDRPLQSRVSLREFAAWVRQIGWDAPAEFLGMADPRPQDIDWNYWRALDLWPIDAACKLVCNADPNEPTRDRDIQNPDTFTRPRWVNLFHQATAAIGVGRLNIHENCVVPAEFIAWAAQNGWAAPPEFLAMVDKKDDKTHNEKRTGAATATRKARKVDRQQDLSRFIKNVYVALDKDGLEIGEDGARNPLPVPVDVLYTLFRVRHPEHEVSQSTFADDLGKIATIRPGRKRYDITRLAEMLAGNFSG